MPRSQPHPRAQVQSLVRSAKIAIGKADRAREYAGLYGSDYAEDIARAAELYAKARTQLQKAIALNEEHQLGYPVNPGMLP